VVIMKINLGDIVPTSTLDWPGKVALVVFMKGCPLRCPYCSNAQLTEASGDDACVDMEKVNSEILRASGFIDGVIFSGGEPFMQPATLKEAAAYVKGLGLLVGVHTNGVYPDRIEDMASAGLLDAVFLDAKAPMAHEPYKIAGGEMEQSTFEAIKRALTLCCTLRRDEKISFLEVRTTVFRGISDKPDDIKSIVSAIECADAYVIQQGRPEVAMDEKLKATEAVHRDELLVLAGAAVESAKGIKTIKVRTHTFGDEIIK
jgi:pyruvate formate lyase activating enzyme